MKNRLIFKFELAFIFIGLIMLMTSCNDMSKSDRIKNVYELKNIQKIALLNFSINRDCEIGSGEDVSYVNNIQEIKNFGKFHMSFFYSKIKTQNKPTFLDFNNMIESKNYKNFIFYDSYIIYKIESLPKWLSPEITYINPYDAIGILKVNSDNSKDFCKSLNTDAVLSMEVTYSLDHGFSIPILGTFIKPNWIASCKVNSELYNSRGELVWWYKFKVDSPIKVKSNKSLNLIVYSNTSITGAQTNELIESVVKYSSQKIIDALYGDINE